MVGIEIVDESQSVLGGLYNHLNHRNVTRIWTKNGNLGLSYTDMCFLGLLIILLIIILVFILRLCYHYAKKFCCTKSGKTVMKQAFVDDGRQRLINEEDIICDDKPKRLDQLSYFVENDFNTVLHVGYK